MRLVDILLNKYLKFILILIYILTIKTNYHWSSFSIRCAQDQNVLFSFAVVTVSIVSSTALTCVAAVGVCTVGVGVTIVISKTALVDVGANKAGAVITDIAGAIVRSVVVCAGGVCVTVMRAQTALVNVGAS